MQEHRWTTSRGYAAASARDALQRDTFEVGIALLTGVSPSADDSVESVYWIERACMPHPYYITLRVHGLDSIF